MRIKRFISVLLLMAMLFTSVSGITSYAEDEDRKDWRMVGIHAQTGDNIAPDKPSTLYLNEPANIYLSVDKPNKGNPDHSEAHYDLNGFSVKFYYDDAYFDLNTETPDKPINYKLPDESLSDSTKDEMNENVPAPGASYYAYKHGAYPETINGKTYQVAYATVLYSGSWLPNKDVKWYDLCALPIVPRLAGTTEVYVEYSTKDDYSLELYSKNKPGESTKNFDLTVVNGGRHTIIIEDQPKPAAPVLTPAPGTYPEKQTITISAGEDCEIYYSLDGGTEQKYNGPFEILETTTIVCYAKKTTGEQRESDRVTCTYKITASRPYLFKEDGKTLVPDIYDTETESYKVYFSDTADESRDIPDDTEIYYTFRDDIPLTYPVAATDDPNEGWVKVPKRLRELSVDSPCNVRIVTDKNGTLSEVVSYKLSFSPAEVEAVDYSTSEPRPSQKYDEPIEIKLVTPTNGAQIYYTLDGSSPLGEANLYDPDVPIVIVGEKTLRAVAKIDGKYGPVMTNWYIIEEEENDYRVDAFYPSGKYVGGVTVALSPSNPEYTIEYKLDGDDTWKTYDMTKPFEIDNDTVIIARALDKNGNANGEEYEFIYKIMPLPPVFSPESTQFTNSNHTTVYCGESNSSNTGRYTLYYTTDGTWPITIPTDGSDPVLVDSPSVKKADAESDSADVAINESHTVVTAVVCKDGKYFSEVVQHSYSVVKQRPLKPLTSLTPGIYHREVDTPEDFDFTTIFLPVSTGTEIYYTVSYEGEQYCPDPVANTTLNGTIPYDKNNPEPILIKGETVIKAVAVNRYGAKSDIGIFKYTVIPESPQAAPGATVDGDELPVVPVKAVAGSDVTYTIGGFTNKIENAPAEFYIDTKTGTAYENPDDPSSVLGTAGNMNNTGSVLLEISSEMDGVKGEPNYYTYSVGGDDEKIVAPPYADKKSGYYDEIDIDGENNLLIIRLNSLNTDAKIQYMINNSSKWEDYDDNNPVRIKDGDAVLQVRCVKGEGNDAVYSKVVSYTYLFRPVPPLITLDSGRYSLNPVEQTQIMLDEAANPHKPYNKYEIYYRRNGDKDDFPLKWDNKDFYIELDHTMSVKAYVLNTKTGRTSQNAVRYYIVESDVVTGGAVEIDYPYYGVKRVALHRVLENPWNSGIKLFTDNLDPDVDICYTYIRTLSNGTNVESKPTIYDSASPIAITGNTSAITIMAWLVNSNGEIAGTRRTFDKILFETFDPPKPSLEDEDTILFKAGTEYRILDLEEYENDPTMFIYYTTDGTDPVVYDPVTGEATIKGTLFKDDDEPLILNSDTTVKTVYRSTCGTCYFCDRKDYDYCQHPIFGKIGEYRYAIKKSGGGGGGAAPSASGSSFGSGIVNNTRRYTKDIFSNEHPTHIGYIKGYPDGSVQPDGHITREEVAVILYRIKNKTYDAPFMLTGEVFPDVAKERWSALEIEYMTADEVIKGYPDGEFKPSRNLTRAEFASLIRRFVKLGDNKTSKAFYDLPQEHWAYSDIIALSGAGLLEGYEDGTFRPENNITRAETMTVINKLLGRKPLESYVKSLEFNPFNDLLITKWYYVTVLEATITHNYYLGTNDFEIKWEDYK